MPKPWRPMTSAPAYSAGGFRSGVMTTTSSPSSVRFSIRRRKRFFIPLTCENGDGSTKTTMRRGARVAPAGTRPSASTSASHASVGFVAAGGGARTTRRREDARRLVVVARSPPRGVEEEDKRAPSSFLEAAAARGRLPATRDVARTRANSGGAIAATVAERDVIAAVSREALRGRGVRRRPPRRAKEYLASEASHSSSK